MHTISRLKSGGSLFKISAASSSIIWADDFPEPDDDCFGKVLNILVKSYLLIE